MVISSQSNNARTDSLFVHNFPRILELPSWQKDSCHNDKFCLKPIGRNRHVLVAQIEFLSVGNTLNERRLMIQAKGRGGKDKVPGWLKFSVHKWREEWRKEEISRRVKRKWRKEEISRRVKDSVRETFRVKVSTIKLSDLQAAKLETRAWLEDITFIS